MSTSLLTDTALTVGGQVFKNVIGTSYSPGTGTTTITAAMMIGGFIERGMDNVSGTFKIDEVDSAANIVAAIPEVAVNSSFTFTINVTGAVSNTKQWSLSNGTTASAGTTLVGYTEAIPGEGIEFLVRVTNASSGSEAVTIYASAVAKIDAFTFEKSITVGGSVFRECEVYPVGNFSFQASQQNGIFEKSSAGFALTTMTFAKGVDVVASINDCRVNSSIDFFVKNTSTTDGYLKLNKSSVSNDLLVGFTTQSYFTVYPNQMRQIKCIVNNITSGSEQVTYYDLGIVRDDQLAQQSLYINERVYPTTTVSNITSNTGTSYQPSALTGGIILRTTSSGSAKVDTFASAATLVASMDGPAFVHTSFDFNLVSVAASASNVNLITGAVGSGNTLVTQVAGGTVVVAPGEGRLFLVVFTNVTSGSEAVTYYDLGKSVY